MKLVQFIILLSVLFVISSCDNNQKQIQEKHDEVMEIHDAVMPKMAEMNKLSRNLKKNLELDSISNGAEIKKAVAKLEMADKAMFDWMANYNKPSENMDINEALRYLDTQKAEITAVKDLMLNSISEAKRLLNK